MLDIIKNKINIDEFNEYIHNEHCLENYVFDIIDIVFNNYEYLPYLENVFIELNKRDLNILQNIKNKNNQTIHELYESTQCDQTELNTHISKFLNYNIKNILSLFNMPKEQTKDFNDILLERIEKLENEVEQLKVWITNKDFVPNNMR